MKMANVNTVFIREEGQKHSLVYIFNVNFNFLTYIKQNYSGQQKLICSSDYEVTIGGVTHKASTYRELIALRFLLKNHPEIKKSSTIKGLK